MEEILEECIKEGLEELNSLPSGSEDYERQASAVAKLIEKRNDQMKLERDYELRIDELNLENRKAEADAIVENRNNKWKFIGTCGTIAVGIASIAIPIIANHAGMKQIMRFEESGHTFTTKAFQKVPKIGK